MHDGLASKINNLYELSAYAPHLSIRLLFPLTGFKGHFTHGFSESPHVRESPTCRLGFFSPSLFFLRLDYGLQPCLVQIFVLVLQNFEKLVQICELKRVGCAPKGK